MFCLPGVEIPKWFNYQNRGASISFWFRNKFPDKVLCVLVAPMQDNFFRPMVLINGKECTCYSHHFLTGKHHAYLCDLRELHFTNSPYVGPFENEWKVTFPRGEYTSFHHVKMGIYIVKQENSMEDVRFTDPCSKRKTNVDLNSFDSQSTSC